MVHRYKWLIELVKRDLEKEFVSHYTSLNTFVFDILPSNTIKFSTLENTNDPYEYKVNLGVVSGDVGLETDKGFYFRAEDFLKDNVKVFCTSVSSEKRKLPKYTPLTDCSFWNVMMWAQYGGNHNGAVLLFEKKELEKIIQQKFEKYFIGKVNYKDISKIHFSVNHNSTKSFEENICDELERDKENRFFSKQKEWVSEKEFRWVLFNKEEKGNEFVDFKNSLKAVILGEKTKNKTIHVVSKLLKETKIDLYLLVWDHIALNNFKLKRL